MTDYTDAFEHLLAQDVFSLNAAKKREALMPVFDALHHHHLQHSDAYRNITSSNTDLMLAKPSDSAGLPYLAVRLFKQFSLSSVPQSEVFRMLQSSGTTSQTPAKVVLDKATSARQSKVLVKIMQSIIGKQRLPMLIIDSPSVLKNKALSARAAGIQGMAFFGRKPVYALNDDMSLNINTLHEFQAEYGEQPVLLFGFTFMVWASFVQALKKAKVTLSLPKGILIHSGGWKKLIDQQVDNATFKAGVQNQCGISRVHNFYGMAEQVGTVFIECEHGHLHAPTLADIIVRSTTDLSVLPQNHTGLIQVLSSIPTSYPGYSLLTEDLGRILGEDDCPCGRKGKYFEVLGRLPKTEIRGCSDTQEGKA